MARIHSFDVGEIKADETDYQGTAYYGRLLPSLDAARNEMFRNSGFPPEYFVNSKFDLQLAFLGVKYHNPVKIGESLTIHTLTERVKGASINLSQQVWQNNDTLLLYTVWTEIACVSETTGRPTRVPKELAKLLLG